MLLSCNLIKSEGALVGEKKKIETNYVKPISEEEKKEEFNRASVEEEIKKNYENLGVSIIRKSKIEAEQIVMYSRKEAVDIEKKAYEEGHDQGEKNGYEDGYREGYNNGLDEIKTKTEEKVKVAIEKSQEILKLANKEYKNYIKEKEEEVVKLAFKMAEKICGQELTKKESLLPIIEKVLNEAKGEENIIIRCNSEHIKVIEEKIPYYKKAYAIKGEIFVLEDPLMEVGNAIIEKDTGKAVVGLDIALEKLEEALFKQ